MADPDLPGYSRDRLRWQAPSVLPSGSLTEMARAVREGFQGVYAELVALASRRNVVALQDSMAAREGQVLAGVAAGQVIVLPSPNPGDFGTISVLVTSVKSDCTVVNIDASTFSLSAPGLYEFGIGPDDTAWRGTALSAGSIPLTALAAQAANTVVANATAAAASPTAFPVGTNTVLGRVGANIVAAQLVGAQVAPATLPLTTLATQAANTVLANATAGVASPTAITVGAESVFGQTSGNLQGIASAVQTALIRAAGSVFWAAAAANQVLRRSGSGDLGFGLLVDGNLTTNTISAASQAQMAANSVKANATAGAANEADLAVGTNTVVGRVAGNVVAAQLVAAQVTNNTITSAQQAQPAANTIRGNPTAGAANIADIAVAVQSILLRAAGNIVNSAAAADTCLQRVGSADLAFSATPRLLRAPQLLTSGTTISHPTGTRLIYVEGVGGGGAGGGIAAGAGSMGGQGGSGTYGWVCYTAAASSSTFTIGAAGTGVSGAPGNAGGSSTFTHNAVTMTLPGGNGGGFAGAGATVGGVLGGGVAAAATNATFSIRGQPGCDAARPVAAATPLFHLGPGGSNPLGTGAAGRFASGGVIGGLAAQGFGAGGGGALQPVAGAAAVGGAGTIGCFRVWEFS